MRFTLSRFKSGKEWKMYAIYDNITAEVLSRYSGREWRGGINEEGEVYSAHIFGTLEEAVEAREVLNKEFQDNGDKIDFEIWELQEYRVLKVQRVINTF